MTQCERILHHLQEFGSITSLEAMNWYGCYRLASRIAELRQSGVNITKRVVKGKNKYGESIHFAEYRLGG
jgi:hypothetical protein